MRRLHHCPVCYSQKLYKWQGAYRKYDPLFLTAESTRENWILEHIVKKKKLKIWYLFCTKCFHIFSDPTFSDDEITEMYNYSGYHETIEKARKTANRRFPSSTYEAYVDNPLNQESLLFRPEFIYSMVKSYIPEHPKRIADIGGGEGHNLIGFQKNNAECFVLDVADGPQKVHGIKKTKMFEELKRYAPYHVMVSTHTLEHIVNVGYFLDQYTPLTDYFYCEVPSQYSIRYLKIRKPFLTEHVNYFSISSLRYLFENRGFRTLHLSVKYLPYQIFRMPVLVGIFQRIKSTPSAFVQKSHFLPFLIRELAIFAHIHIYHRLHGHYPPLYF